MYSRQEESQLRSRFWTNFGQYMTPVPSADGNTINWINYKTGVRNIQFKMDALKDQAYVAVELSHKDSDTQALFFQHFISLRSEFESILAEAWQWEPASGNTTKSRIYTTMTGVNVCNMDDWPAIISFLKTRITKLDAFWFIHKDLFEMLG